MNATQPAVEHGHVDVVCNCYRAGCMFCDGGLWACETCGGLEGGMPSTCPGQKMTGEQERAVYAGRLDYRDGQWVEDVASRFAPMPARMKTNSVRDTYRNATGLEAVYGALVDDRLDEAGQ